MSGKYAKIIHVHPYTYLHIQIIELPSFLLPPHLFLRCGSHNEKRNSIQLSDLQEVAESIYPLVRALLTGEGVECIKALVNQGADVEAGNVWNRLC